MAAEVGAGAVPKCHKAALVPCPSGTKGPLCPQPGRSNSVLPLGAPRSLSPARGRTLPSQGFWKEHSLPTSCTRICLGRSSAEARYSTEAPRQNSCKSHP